jgi:rhodanese-related sulfurtransferase
LDSRDYTSFYKVHAKGASNITLEGILKADQLYYPQNKKVVLYGTSDQAEDLKKAADKIHKAGVTKVYVVSDGIEGFRGAGYPLNENIPISLQRLDWLGL